MELDKALQIIEQACGSVVADLNTHNQVQMALQIVREHCKAKQANDLTNTSVIPDTANK